MIKRYNDEKIQQIWDQKLKLWEKIERLFLQAKVNLGFLSVKIPNSIFKKWNKNKINEERVHELDKILHHDLNAFITERKECLSPMEQTEVHKKITSYDTEETPFVDMLESSATYVRGNCIELLRILSAMAKKYRHTMMCSRTHGQPAELISFGKRCLGWYVDLFTSVGYLTECMSYLVYSKFSGASGNYGSIPPAIEKEVLRLYHNKKPYYGATQILPRLLFAPLANALSQIALVLHKIALDIRLGARGGLPIYHEPFKKKQTGSSAMPHKKNTIRTEQVEGMANMAAHYADMLIKLIPTWEERSIEQSSVERVAWPDLFHVVSQSTKVMKEVLGGLVVYPDNMLEEIINTRGCYASSEAKELIKQWCVLYELDNDDGYRIVQLAAFNVFEPSEKRQVFRQKISSSFADSDLILQNFSQFSESFSTIQELMPAGKLRYTEQLDISKEKIQVWNGMLRDIFKEQINLVKWNEVFQPSFLLKNEDVLFKEILGA